MRLNVNPNTPRREHNQAPLTHEGAPAAELTPEQALRRSVLSCLLHEKEFYEDGEEISARIARLAAMLPPSQVAALACETRTEGQLRHVPLLLLSVLAQTGAGSANNDGRFTARDVALTIERVIQRADELGEFLAVHAKRNGVHPNAMKKTLSAQMKKGLARAFLKFDEYQLAKYNRDGPVKLRDALFLCHAKPRDEAQDALWKRLIAGELQTPDTWEVRASATGGADKKATWEGIIDMWIKDE